MKNKLKKMSISISNYISKKGNEVTLNGINLNQQENEYLLNDIIIKYPNITECDVNNCNLKAFPKQLMELKKISSLDIRNNQFTNFEILVESLTIYNNLTDLKIDLTDQNQVLLILSQIPKLILLNGKSTKDAVTIIDIEEKDIEEISLQNDLPLYTEIVNKLNSIEADQNFINDFQSKLYDEAEKVKLCLNNNSPNYIYANTVIQSQFILQKYLSEKFMEKLDEKNKEIASLLFKNIFCTGENLIGIVNLLYPKIEEKTESLRSQLEEALKNNDDFTEFEQKFKEVNKEKEILSNEKMIIQNKLDLLENENKIMTEKLLNNAKEIYEKNKETIVKETKEKSISKETTSYNNNINSINNLTYGNNINKNSLPFLNLSTPKILTIKNTKDIINEIYNSKTIYDKKCYDNKIPRETMEQHMYTYLNHKYGLKSLIIEWAAALINAIKLYSNQDSDINLFGKILRNEQEEDSRFILTKLRSTISELFEFYLKSKNPLKSQIEIKKMLDNKKNGILNEEEWKGIIYYIYSEEDAKNLENKISNFISKINGKFDINFNINTQNPNNLISENNITIIGNNNNNSNLTYGNNNYINTLSSTKLKTKLTREEIFNLSKNKEEMNIPYKDFIRIVCNHQIKTRDKYLKNFVKLFKKYDNDSDGILNEEDFINLVKSIPYCQNNIEEYIFKFLSIIDPFNNKKITFSECVSLFSMEEIEEEENENQSEKNQSNSKSLLDKICLENL